MAIMGVLFSIASFMVYFSFKYSVAMERVDYSRSLSFREVYVCSLDGHSLHRAAIAIKWMGILAAFSGLFGWSVPLSHKDIAAIWKAVATILLGTHVWARLQIYYSSHYKKVKEEGIQSPVLLTMLRSSVREIGWIARGKGWLVNTVNITSVFFLLIAFVRIIVVL